MRSAIRFALALAIAFGLFWFMHWLVLAGKPPLAPAPTVTMLDQVRVAAPPPPPPPPPPAAQKAPKPTTPARPVSPLAIELPAAPAIAPRLPQFDPPVAVIGRLQTTGVLTGVAGGDALAAFQRGERGFTGDELIPVSSARPKYPRSAAERGIEGWVELIYVVTGEGRVENVRVLDASPRGVFEDTAVRAMRNWIYAPYYVNGKPVAREATQMFRFQVEDIQEIYLWND